MSDFSLNTAIWQEDAEPDNPFVAARCFAHGYDVYGEILPHASWFEYLLLLLQGERPSPQAVKTLERLAIALANPGPREASVRAAMNGGVGGSVHASSLIAALAVGAGQCGGAQEVSVLVDQWAKVGLNKAAWLAFFQAPNEDYSEDIWGPFEHAPGFDPNGVGCATPVQQTLNLLAELSPGMGVSWLQKQQQEFQKTVGAPLSFSAVAAAAFYDLALDSRQSTMLFLMLRLPGAAVHALEWEVNGWKKFPAYGSGIRLSNDPASKTQWGDGT